MRLPLHDGAIKAWNPKLSSAKAFPEIEACLPHRGEMLLIDRVIDIDYERHQGAVAATIKQNKPYIKADVFQSHWLVEMMAQAVAATYTLVNRAKAPPSQGFLISIDHFAMLGSKKLMIGDELIISVRLAAEFIPIAKYLGYVMRYKDKVAEAEMKFSLVPGGLL